MGGIKCGIKCAIKCKDSDSVRPHSMSYHYTHHPGLLRITLPATLFFGTCATF